MTKSRDCMPGTSWCLRKGAGVMWMTIDFSTVLEGICRLVRIRLSPAGSSWYTQFSPYLLKISPEGDLVTRYVDMGAINASDAELDSTDWREYYRQWRYLSRMSREAGLSAEIADMLSEIEIMLTTHRPGDCDCHVEKSGLRLRK